MSQHDRSLRLGRSVEQEVELGGHEWYLAIRPPGMAIMLAIPADSGNMQRELANQWFGDEVVRPIFPRSAT
jgi:hypothetical protein